MYNFKRVSMGYTPEEVNSHIRSLQDEHQAFVNRTKNDLSTVVERITRITAAISQMNMELEGHAESHRHLVQLFNEQIHAAEDLVKHAHQEREQAIMAALARLTNKKENLALWQSRVREAREELLVMQTKLLTQAR